MSHYYRKHFSVFKVYGLTVPYVHLFGKSFLSLTEKVKTNIYKKTPKLTKIDKPPLNNCHVKKERRGKMSEVIKPSPSLGHSRRREMPAPGGAGGRLSRRPRVPWEGSDAGPRSEGSRVSHGVCRSVRQPQPQHGSARCASEDNQTGASPRVFPSSPGWFLPSWSSLPPHRQQPCPAGEQAQSGSGPDGSPGQSCCCLRRPGQWGALPGPAAAAPG